MIENKDSAKHLAQTLRILGVAQFAHYGVNALDNVLNDNYSWVILLASAGVFAYAEIKGAQIINIGARK